MTALSRREFAGAGCGRLSEAKDVMVKSGPAKSCEAAEKAVAE